MIPKIIHYCWFGGNELPELAIKCLNSWKKHCKGYKIIEWNENNFDISKAPLYVRQAYEAKKWAFVSDYVRLWALVNHGGVYMDTDVQVVKPLDKFLVCNAFSGFEDDIHISTGIMGCEKDFPLFVEFLDYYNDALFLNSDGSFNTVTNVIIMTKICSGIGLEQNNKFQVIDGFALYPKDYFCWGVSWEVPLHYGVINKQMILDQKDSSTMSDESFARESNSIWSNINSCSILKKSLNPGSAGKACHLLYIQFRICVYSNRSSGHGRSVHVTVQAHLILGAPFVHCCRGGP